MLGLAGGFSLSEGNLGGQIPWMSQGSLGLVGGWQASGERKMAMSGNVHLLFYLLTPYVLSSSVLSSLVSLPLPPPSLDFFAVLADKHLLPKSGGILITTSQVVSIIILEGL